MCGIAGWVDLVPSTPERTMRSMVAALHHRGPDDQGWWIGPRAALGMARLAIIDLDHGQQPKCSGPWQVVFNGEIYNYRALRRELVEAGCTFTTDSDTEVVAHGIATWGTDAFHRFDGMFAIAAYESSAHRLLLARDRFGEKPLYLWPTKGGLAFASEPKALRPIGDLGRVDPDALVRYLHLGYVAGADTIWSELQRLEAGHHAELVSGELTVSASTVSASTVSAVAGCTSSDGEGLRSPAAAADRRAADDGERAVDELDRRLRASVTSRLVADVEVGVLLSGGIDSSLVAAHAAAVHPRIRTFTVAVQDPARDESGPARAVATRLGTDHTEIAVGEADALDVVDQIPRIYDEPFADSSALPTLLLSQVVSGHVKVALAGEGGDEAFSGYPRFARAHARPTWGTSVPPGLTRVAQRAAWQWWVRPRDPVLRATRMIGSADVALVDGVAMVPRALLARLGAPLGALVPLDQLARRAGDAAPGRSAEAFDMALALTDDLLVKIDRASMAHGLEVRVPFLAPTLVDWAATLPDAVLGAPGAKALPRALARRYYGPEIADRPKRGFSVPLPRWLRGELRPLADQICDGELVRSGFLDRRAVISLRRSLDRRFDAAAAPIWVLAMFERWHDEWRSSL